MIKKSGTQAVPCMTIRRGQTSCRSFLRRLGGGEHILYADAVALLGLIHKDMGHCAYQLPVLYDGRAGQECVKYRTTLF